MGQFGKYMVFETQLYEIWKLAFNVESDIFFMHYEPTTYFVPRLALRVSKLVASWVHVNTDRNRTAEKHKKNQYLTIWTQSYQFSQNFMLSFCPNPTVFPANHILNNTTHLGPFVHYSLLLSEIIQFFL